MHTSSIDIVFPASQETRIGSVTSPFGYLMYYVRKQIETNANTNTDKMIMTKLYGISCHHLCHRLCCQLLSCWYKNSFRVQLIIYCMVER